MGKQKRVISRPQISDDATTISSSSTPRNNFHLMKEKRQNVFSFQIFWCVAISRKM
jgi:hypothetical protein